MISCSVFREFVHKIRERILLPRIIDVSRFANDFAVARNDEFLPKVTVVDRSIPHFQVNVQPLEI